MKIFYTLIFSLLLFKTSFAQKGEVIVIKDPLIDSLIAKRLEVYKTSGEVKTGKPIVSAYGYRVQIFYGSDRREVFNEQARFKGLYPKLNTYLIYKEPNYYVRVGDFRTRLEAQRLINELRPSFPTLFIFREKINAPNLDTNTTDDQK
ncbi:SPOR domain-containing protein [Pedobacter sp. HDW13]|uniref:SPOR domain-containing protein n=1 Tax=unclassified Pedobacter TaxID=2628915 RepID=UPI000F5B14A3|nr:MULTISPECIES: SPOR domain-containing protein [unclassified Pedobacter]QIL39927.1 SPOR domain-containing protein [Pedobacter sp. HDW13]RQO65390.1 SPOR domain-containing protein [Pedobacter sp. KBW01]